MEEAADGEFAHVPCSQQAKTALARGPITRLKPDWPDKCFTYCKRPAGFFVGKPFYPSNHIHKNLCRVLHSLPLGGGIDSTDLRGRGGMVDATDLEI